MKTVDQLSLEGERVLLRVDFNVPLDDGIVDDNFRILSALPTIEFCIENGASVVLMSHLGRPKGTYKREFSLFPVAEELESLLDLDIFFTNDCISDQAFETSAKLEPGQIHLLENLRFHPGEEANDPDFSKQLARHGTLYVNDAFGTAHRAHASNVGVVPHLKDAAIGKLMGKEYHFLETKIKEPKSPFALVLGGAKIAGKLELIQNFLPKADKLIIGGGMAFTFLKAQGHNIGGSMLDKSLLAEAGEVLKLAEKENVEVVLPVDVVAAKEISEDSPWRVAMLDEIEGDEKGVDIGPESCMIFSEALQDVQTVVWNGPMGVFENPSFRAGTELVAHVIAHITDGDAISIIGGGDTASAVNMLDDPKHFTHISTGGGASLELLCGRKLPAWEALK